MAELAKTWDDRSSKLAQRRRHYETIFVVSPAVEESTLKALTDKLTQVLKEAGAEILRQDHWGKLRMAYEIEKHATGDYFYYRYIGGINCVAALERALKLDASILRYQTVRLSEDLTNEEIQALIERAPKEASVPPNVSVDDESPDFH